MGEEFSDAPSLRESPTLSEHEAQVLSYLQHQGGDERAFGFATISGDLFLSRDEVRKACRSLAAAGLLRFYRSLLTDEGVAAGAGYGCTREGLQAVGHPDWTQASESNRKDGSSPQNTEAQS